MPFRGRRQYKKTASRFGKRSVAVYSATKSKRVASIPKKSFNRAVRRVIRQEEEVKVSPQLTIFDQSLVHGTGLDYNTGFGLTSLGIVPTVPNGTGDNQRIGNVINVRKLQLKYTIQALPVSLATGSNPNPALPFLIRVIVYRHRYAMDDPQNNNILDVGSTTSNLGSTPDYWVEPYNRKEFIIVHSKQWTMQPIKSFYSGLASAISENVANGSKQFITHKCNIKMPRKLLFNDGGILATNANYYMAVAVCNIDGSSNVNTWYRAQVNAEAFLYYTDA